MEPDPTLVESDPEPVPSDHDLVQKVHKPFRKPLKSANNPPDPERFSGDSEQEVQRAAGLAPAPERPCPSDFADARAPRHLPGLFHGSRAGLPRR
jgi:hypothetical protein